MARSWNADFLIRRIDRCYLLAACARHPEKRDRHLMRARHYRGVLADAREMSMA
jgi:hypothetical protein